jgi:hypothetical protein
MFEDWIFNPSAQGNKKRRGGFGNVEEGGDEKNGGAGGTEW